MFFGFGLLIVSPRDGEGRRRIKGYQIPVYFYDLSGMN